jgi:hypothetical protein
VAAALKPERGHGKAEGGSRNWKPEHMPAGAGWEPSNRAVAR